MSPYSLGQHLILLFSAYLLSRDLPLSEECAMCDLAVHVSSNLEYDKILYQFCILVPGYLDYHVSLIASYHGNLYLACFIHLAGSRARILQSHWRFKR